MPSLSFSALVRTSIISLVTAVAGGFAADVVPVPAPAHAAPFIEQQCAKCHDEVEKKGGVDLTALVWNPASAQNFATWIKVHDLVRAGEMPPKDKARPPAAARDQFIGELSAQLIAAEHAAQGGEGRATQRRLNRYEYENALRDLLGAPWLQLRDGLPEDREAYRFNKIGDALDMSHINLARYLIVAEKALRDVLQAQVNRPATMTTRYYAREQRTFVGKMTYSFFNVRADRATFPVLGTQAQPDVRSTKQPITVGEADPATRELEAMGTVASAYEPIELRFEKFRAPVSGRYKVRVSAYSVWAGPGREVPGKPYKWWQANYDDISPGRRPEPIVLYAEVPPRLLRRLGAFDVGTEPTTGELDVHLLAGEMIRPDCVRFFRSRAGASQNPLATKEGQPAVAFRWLEIEGPLPERETETVSFPLFGDLRITKSDTKSGVQVETQNPTADAARLLGAFIAHAYRRPVDAADRARFLPVIERELKAGTAFADAMIVGYTAVLCSPSFLRLEEKPGSLDDHAIASRLSFFLWNSAPDAHLRELAARGELRRPEVLRAQVDRLLDAPKGRQFVDAFLDYWLELRKLQATTPDAALYNDYYLDDALVEWAGEETQLFFAELLRRDLPVRSLVATDFAFLNERLATHYGIPGVAGVEVRRVALPPDSPRGGLLTQASVLKVTANGTTTSPVVRGAWVMERILGLPPSPPPPSVPAVEPDIRGANTIRQLLDRHRSDAACASCHTRIDPAGFALESFDVFGGWRDKYRAIVEGIEGVPGNGKGGYKFAFHYAQPVDATGELWDGRKFSDIRDFKRLLVAEEPQLARNLAQQFVVYATGAPIGFSDRPAIEAIVRRAAAKNYGLRSLLHEVVQSELFLNK